MRSAAPSSTSERAVPLAMRVASDALLDNGAMEILSAAAAEYFRGDVNHQLESAMGVASGDQGFVQEIQTTTEDTYHFMSVIPGKEQTILMLVTDRDGQPGPRMGCDAQNAGARSGDEFRGFQAGVGPPPVRHAARP